MAGRRATTISLRVDPSIRDDFEDLADIDRRSMSWEVKEAMRLYADSRRDEIEAYRRRRGQRATRPRQRGDGDQASG